MDSRDRPIGFWVKELDRLIDEAFASADLTRREWQLLNTMREPQSLERIQEALAPFLGVEDALTSLRAKGFVRTDATHLALTREGEAARRYAQGQVNGVRARLSRNISAGEYAATIATLTRMCANLGSAAAS